MLFSHFKKGTASCINVYR